MNSIEHLNISNSELDNFISELNHLATHCRQIKTRRKNLIEFKGHTDFESKELDRKINPEEYYSFKFFEWGIEIVYSDNFFNRETETWYKNHNKYTYTIRCYYWKSKRLSKNLPKLTDGNINYYGNFDKLDDAILIFKRLIIEMFTELGCNSLDPLDFF